MENDIWNMMAYSRGINPSQPDKPSINSPNSQILEEAPDKKEFLVQ